MNKPKKMVGLRLEHDMRVVLEKLAEDDDRSLAATVNKIVKVFLREKGLLAERPRKAAK